MAISTRYLTGFEHGFVGSAAAVAGGGLTGGTTTPGTGWTANTSSPPRNGGYCARLVAPANTATQMRFPVSGAPTKIVGRFAVKVAVSENVTLFTSTDGSAGTPFSLGISFGSFIARIGSAGQSGASVLPGQWRRIEFQIDTVAKTFDWKVNGVLQTRPAIPPEVISAPVDFGLGTKETTEATFTADYDDWIFGTWTVAGTDWYGDGKVLGQLAGLDGTHATITSLSPGDAGTAYSGTPTTVNTMVDDPPGTLGWTATRSTTDNVALRTATVGAYASIGPAATAEATLANAVRALVSYSSPATGANLAACDVRNSAGTVTALRGTTGGVGATYNLTANQFGGGIVTAPGAGWTAAEVNAVRWRFGGCTSVDINPVPTVQAMMLEVDWSTVAAASPERRTNLLVVGGPARGQVRDRDGRRAGLM